MKKIYMILAAMSLLTLSLNAQTMKLSKAPTRATKTSTLTFTAACNGSGTADDGTVWTVTSDAAESNFDSSRGIHYGTNSAAVSYINLTTSGITGNITSIVVNASRASRASGCRVDVTVGGNQFGNGPFTINTTDATDFTFTGSATGEIVVSVYKTTSGTGALYCKSITVTYEEIITDPTIQVSTNSVSMSAAPGSSATETVTVTGLNLTGGINASISGTDAALFDVRPTSLGTSGGTLTITYSPTATGTHSATITLTEATRAGADPVTITLNGTCSNSSEGTIGDGTSSDYYLPAYGSYQDYGYKNQMIYTAAQLAEIGIQNGDQITSITFYPTTASGYNGGIDFYGSTVTLSLANTELSSFSGSKITPSDLTDMVTITPVRDNNATEWTFSWSTPFTYTGNNLLVQVYCPGYEKDGTNGDYGRTYFKGDNQNSNVSLYSYNSTASSTSGTSGTTGTNSTFQPQATFTFESGEPVHDLSIAMSDPESVLAGETATITATVTNNGNQTENGYTVTFTIDGNTTTLTASEPLAPGAETTFTTTYTTTAAQGGTTVSIAANVACTDDTDATNNDATATLTVNAPVHDLGITLSQPTAVLVGETATITATVTNNGNQTESGYTVTFSDGTNTFSTQTGGTLAPGATETFTATYTTSAAGTVTITANVACTGDADATNDEATATLTVTVPVRELTAPTNGETVDVGTNNGMGVSVTIPVSGNNLTEDVTVSVSGAGFTVSPTTLSAADVNAGTATVTITYNGTTSGTGTLTFSSSEFANVTVNLTGSYSTGIAPTAHGMVRMGTLRIVDQFAEKIPATNDHPYRYTYFLKLATRDTTSSPARVPVQHTGAEMNGYYTHAEMKGDTDPANFLTEDMLSAEVEMNLSPSSAPYFYTINSVKNGVPASVTDYNNHYKSYLNVLQRREAGDYQEMQAKYNDEITNPHKGGIYAAGAHDFFDYRAIQAETKDDSLSYVPIVWTKGIDRHYYVEDSLHNSYGAPIWEVRTGDVMIDQSGTVCQRQVAANGGWNSTVNYTVDGTNYSLYLVSVNAKGILPESNIDYEPYMFRLWLYDDNASLRNYTWMENDNWTKIEDAGAYTENGGKWKLLDTKMCENWGVDIDGNPVYHADTTYVVNINPGTSANPQSWQNNIGFVAPISGFTPKLYVRFYYKIKGAPDPTINGMRGDGDEDNVGYVVLRGVNPNPGTGVYEIVVNGEVESQTFYNVQGMQSDKPFPGINIVVTRYSNGATKTTKVRY